jgi:single-strand DNA-binding protein
MMSANNNVNLIGNLGGDPEIYRFENGNAVANFSLAVERVYITDGVKNKDTFWARCTAFGKRAETIALYTKKGHKLAISGELREEKYTNKQGVEVKATRIVVNDFAFLTQRGDNIQVDGQTFPQQTAPIEPIPQSVLDGDDSDLPF